MTPEIQILRAKADQLQSIFEMIEFQFVDDPRWGEPSDTSYLTARDRLDPAIMSNVEAIEKANGMIA